MKIEFQGTPAGEQEKGRRRPDKADRRRPLFVPRHSGLRGPGANSWRGTGEQLGWLPDASACGSSGSLLEFPCWQMASGRAIFLPGRYGSKRPDYRRGTGRGIVRDFATVPLDIQTARLFPWGVGYSGVQLLADRFTAKRPRAVVGLT